MTGKDLISSYFGELSRSDFKVGCSLTIVRDDCSDWIDISIPTGMLKRLEYPLYRTENVDQLNMIDKILLDAAVMIHKNSPFSLGVIGEEVSGTLYSTSLSMEPLYKVGLIVPYTLVAKLRYPEGEDLGQGLMWYPVKY